ncbi:type II 3-dehydroquinate dehydratase [Mycoplasmatota bacterium WC44]
MKLLILNGVNLNMLGIREPKIYGTGNYEELTVYILGYCLKENIELKMHQTNSESEYIEYLHKAHDNYNYIIVNPGAWTHYSYAIRDAISSINVPCYEVHLSDVDNREEFRKTSVIKDVCIDTVKGFGFDSYIEAIKKMEVSR